MSNKTDKSKIPYILSIVVGVIFLLLGADCMLGGMILLGTRYIMLALAMLCIALKQMNFLPIALIVHAVVTFLSYGLIKGNTFFNVLDMIDLGAFLLVCLIPAVIFIIEKRH